MQFLDNKSKEFINRSIASSTSSQYSACLDKFLQWTRTWNLVAFPLHEQNLVLFVSNLALTSSYGNIKKHLAALKFFSVAHNLPVGTFNRLYLVVRGIRKSQGPEFRRNKRLPVSPDMLRTIKFNLFNSSQRYEDKLMLWAAMVTAFFGFLRVSEYTSKTTKGNTDEQTLCFGDIIEGSNSVAINIKASKTDIFREGVSIRLMANYSSICPVRALQEFRAIHPSRTGPLFLFKDGRFLTRRAISACLKKISGIDANLSSHSFRIGAATTLANLGHPRWLIQSLGRWSSDCFRSYIRISDTTISSVSKSMVMQPLSLAQYDPDMFGM